MVKTSNRTVIWTRDALVIILSIYVVFSIAIAPWANLKPEQALPTSCESGCPPVINYPEDGYYHYKNTIVFEWSSVSVVYRFTIHNSTGNVFHDENITDATTYTTKRLPEGSYTSFVYYRGISGSSFSDEEPLLRSEEHLLVSSSKVTLVWAPIEVTYGIEIREHETKELPQINIIHEAENLTQTSYEFKDFDNGKTYTWSVHATDSLGFTSEPSNFMELNIDTTKFLAFELFNNWEVPFILLGILMVIALQAGVFLAREERND